jgi:hypothetical protein
MMDNGENFSGPLVASHKHHQCRTSHRRYAMPVAQPNRYLRKNNLVSAASNRRSNALNANATPVVARCPHLCADQIELAQTPCVVACSSCVVVPLCALVFDEEPVRGIKATETREQ